MDKLKVVELADELFKIRLGAYWNSSEQLSVQAPIQSNKWRSSIGDHSAKEWYADALRLAEVALAEREQYLKP